LGERFGKRRHEHPSLAIFHQVGQSQEESSAEGPARQNLIAVRVLPQIDLRRPRGYLDRQTTGRRVRPSGTIPSFGGEGYCSTN
jgi:hypothetical protein